MIHCIACRGAHLITTNFYDDLILANNECLKESSKNCMAMELIFLFTDWDFATDGKKATAFSELCCALGVAFNLSMSDPGILETCNTEARVADLVQQLQNLLELGNLNRHDTLKLRGRLGFADGFLHGRLGSLILKRFIDHAYGSISKLDDELAMLLRLWSLLVARPLMLVLSLNGWSLQMQPMTRRPKVEALAQCLWMQKAVAGLGFH